MSKFLQATNLTWSDSTATSVFQNCPVIHCGHGRKEVFVNLLVRKIIYDYMYPVDLENNERSCEYSAIVVPTSKDIVTQPRK